MPRTKTYDAAFLFRTTKEDLAALNAAAASHGLETAVWARLTLYRAAGIAPDHAVIHAPANNPGATGRKPAAKNIYGGPASPAEGVQE